MRRVLVVEDNDQVCSLLLQLLHEAGYESVCAATYAEGKQKLHESRFDLLVCNVLLPGGHGTDLAAIAKAQGVKYLLVTGHPEEMQALDAEQRAYLPKPFRAKVFIDRVNGMWERD